MKELSLHILDVLQNSIEAGASKIDLLIEEDLSADWMLIEIRDNGRGMSPDQIKKIFDPFYTTRKTRHIGLGLPLLLEACRRCEGDLTIRSKPGEGTTVQATFRHSHLDRAPLGDLTPVLIAVLLAEHPVDWTYTHRVNGEEFQVDTAEIRQQLEGIPLTHPKVRHWLRELFVEGENSLAIKDPPLRATA